MGLYREVGCFTGWMAAGEVHLSQLCCQCQLEQAYRIICSHVESAGLLAFTPPQSTLKQLDMEQFSSQVNKYSKYVNQLEKGLPRNDVVPYLREKVEVMTQRVCRTCSVLLT